jgi:hypothetical protein
MVMEETDFDSLESSQDSDLQDGVESVESILGIRGNDSSLDCDYIYNVWNMNEDLFEEDKLTQPFKKPTLNKVKFTWYTWETQWAKLTYKHEIETYGSTKEDIHSYIDGKRQEGDLSPWDGDFVDADTYDSETTDDSIDDNSITIL